MCITQRTRDIEPNFYTEISSGYKGSGITTKGPGSQHLTANAPSWLADVALVRHGVRQRDLHAAMGDYGDRSYSRAYVNSSLHVGGLRSKSDRLCSVGFCNDLLADPAARQVYDIRHEIVAISSSTSLEKAADLVAKINSPVAAKLHVSYASLVADPDVDIVYVATPHSHHFQNAMLALVAGKHVLCEKALTVTAAQAKKLVETARSKGLFFMEAVKTRFFPASREIRALIASGEIGTVYRTFGKGDSTYRVVLWF